MMRSTYEVIYKDKFQCFKCVKVTTEMAREKGMGCTGKSAFIKKTDYATYSQCVGNFYSSAYAQLIDIHSLYRQGIFAGPGGFLDQPSKYIALMELVESLVTERELEKLKILKKQAAKNGRQQSRG